MKVWIQKHLDTPEKARTVISNIALGGGIVGLVLMLIGVWIAHA